MRPSAGAISTAALLMLGRNFRFGATHAMTRWLTRSEPPLAIVFGMVAIQTLTGAAPIFAGNTCSLRRESRLTRRRGWAPRRRG